MWKNQKIKSVKWVDFFQVVPNEYKVFRIIPHLNVRNNQNRHLWHALHKIYELYYSAHSRREFSLKTGIKTRHKDFIWLDMIFKYEKGKKQVEFYMSTSETMAKKFKNTLESRLAVTCELAELKDIQVPTENTVIHELKLMNHDIFSLNTNHTTETTPIEPLLNTLDEMDQDGDFARISILNEREGRKKWLNNSTWAYEKLKKGKVPQRANITPRKVVNTSKTMLGWVIEEISSVIIDTVSAVQNIVFDDNSKGEKMKVNNNQLIDELEISKPSQKTRDKINSPVWKSHIRVAVHSKNKFNRDNISNTINSAFTELSDNNELTAKRIWVEGISVKLGSKQFRVKGRKYEIIEELNTLQPSKKTLIDPNVNYMSCDEMGKLWQLPTSALQQKHAESMKSNRKVETEISSVFSYKPTKEYVLIDGIKVSVGSNNIYVQGSRKKVTRTKPKHLLIGETEKQGIVTATGLPLSNPDEFYKAYVTMGGMGSGKDTLIQNIVKEGNKAGISYIIIDQVNKEGLQGMANGIRDTLPPDKVIDIDLSNDHYLPPLDLTEVMSKLGRKGADRFANELIEFMNVEEMGQSRSILRNFAKSCEGSLYQLKELLENEAVRVKKIKELREQGKIRLADELDKFTSVYEENNNGELKLVKDGQKSLDMKASAIINRLDEFLGDESLFSIFAQPPHKDFKLAQWMQEGKVIIFRVPDRILSTVAVRTLVHWITLQTLMTRMLMSNEEQDNGCFIVYNEPQTYLKENKGLASLMARIAVQGRKERLGSIIACHHIGQISEISEDLISGGVHWLLLKNDNKKTFENLQELLKPTFDIETAIRIENTKTSRYGIAILNFDGKTQPAFLVKLLKPAYERDQVYNNEFLTKRHARMYGRSVDEIEKMLVSVAN